MFNCGPAQPHGQGFFVLGKVGLSDCFVQKGAEVVNWVLLPVSDKKAPAENLTKPDI